VENINKLPLGALKKHQTAIESLLKKMGVTFTVYSDKEDIEKIIPFDVIPRLIDSSTWDKLEEGLVQRIVALNLFIQDIYHEQKIIKDGVIPEHVIKSSKGYLKACVGLKPFKDIWTHISGIDLIRDHKGEFLVLEDNLRCPSGVSYVLENRKQMKRSFPHVFESYNVRPINDYTDNLLKTLMHISPKAPEDTRIAVLTPGIYNSAYFEHSFLAHNMGAFLVTGDDLVVDEGYVKMRTTKGLITVDVIYRRIDDEFMDPTVFRSDSLLGIPGIMNVFREGKVALANAPGTGIADDKVVYAYVPKIIKYYLDQEPKLNNVPTYLCWDEKDRKHTLNNLDKLVVKAANESGGYGMLMGHTASQEERNAFAEKIKKDPRNFIAQPIVSLSTVPTLVEDQLKPRHVDLRPYALYGDKIRVLPGGLTRVALREGSLVVNSSQGGGTKDTWVVDLNKEGELC
jgi:uncharacterized circularly permuted ATP-grasp superfamily protein